VADDGDAGQRPVVQMFGITPRDGRTLKGPPRGGQDGSPALALGKIRTVTSITGSPAGTPSRDLPCRRSLVMDGFSR
jgi:hypothetical protein